MKDFVSGRPFTASVKICEGDSLVIVACDGLWDVVGDQEACELASNVLERLAGEESRAMRAAEALVDLALERDSFDNITVTVCQLLDGNSK
jgi:protein phosphatase PTC1